MTHDEMEEAIRALSSWSDQVADVLNRIIEKIDRIDHRIDNLNARINEWEIKP